MPDVRAAFEELAIEPGQKVVVDLRDVTFLDSSGLGAVIGLYHRSGEHGGRLQLVCGDVTLRLVRLMHLDQVIDVGRRGSETVGRAAASPRSRS